MKKWLSILLITLFSLVLISCKNSKYNYDGIFTAFEVSENGNDPQITWAQVLVEKGEVKLFNIDERQSNDGIWNEKTKKELGYDYGMKGASEIDKEWFEQAETIELAFLKHGVDNLKLTDDGYVDGLAGATMVGDHFQRVAKKALDNAKKGVYTAFEVSTNNGSPQVTWVDVLYDKDEIKSFYIDELQSENGKWNYHTKKELKENYGMKPVSPIDKEWYEQAETIEEFFLANTPEELKLDSEGYVDGLANATMIADSYKSLAIKARDFKNSKTFDNGNLKGNESDSNDEIPTTFNYDGKFIAFETSNNGSSPQITWVEVYVYNGKVHSYYIDELQSNEEGWNEKTKKELGFDYNMKPVSPIDKEWFEQAYEIEKFFLNEGPENLPLDDNNYVDGITGATMVGDTYKKVALKALENAKKGIYTAFETTNQETNPQVTWVEVKYNGSEIESYYIDELQSSNEGWNEKTKKELGFDYNMKPASPIEKEWFEQAEAIEEFFLNEGPENLPLDDNNFVDGITGATMIGDIYKNCALKALSYKEDALNEFKYDGTFKAFDVSLNGTDPQITWVEVVIENGKVKSYFIDERQTTKGVWNDKTKKELGFDYNMKPVSPIDKEWFEQANAIEEFFLENNPWFIELDDEGYIDNIADATMIGNSYRDLAIKALINAKHGILTEFETGISNGDVQVTWVNGFLNENEIFKYYIDELQSNDKVWNEKTKKELGFDYNMKPVSPIDKEWFEQALVLEEKFYESLDENDWNFKEDGTVDGITGATMVADIYYNLAVKVSKLVK